MKKLGLLIALVLEIFIFFEGTLPYSVNSNSDVWIFNLILILGTASVLVNEVGCGR